MTTKEFLMTVLKKFSANIGTIHWLNPNDDFLYLVAHSQGLPKDMLVAIQRIPLQKESITSTTVREKKTIIIQNLSTSSEKIVLPLEKSIGVGGAICVPIFENKNVIGALGIGFLSEHFFSEQETNNLLKMARALSGILISEMLIRNSYTKITQRNHE